MSQKHEIAKLYLSKFDANKISDADLFTLLSCYDRTLISRQSASLRSVIGADTVPAGAQTLLALNEELGGADPDMKAGTLRAQFIAECNEAAIHHLCDDYHYIFTSQEVLLAAKCPLELFKYVQENSGHHTSWRRYICARAACNDACFEVLKYAVDVLHCPIDDAAFSAVDADEPSLRCIEFLTAAGIEWDADCANSAAFSGRLDVLKAMCSTDGKRVPKWNANTLFVAVRRGHLDVVKFLYEAGCECDADVATATAIAGRLDILQYLRENVSRGPCEWNGDLLTVAAENNRMPIIQYARTAHEPCEWNEDYYIAACIGGASEEEAIDIIKYGLAGGCPIGEDAFVAAAKRGSIPILELLMDHYTSANLPIPIAVPSCSAAIYRNHENVLKWLHKNGFKWDAQTMALAAKYGRLHLIKYMRELPEGERCEWDARSARGALKGQHMEVIKYLIDNGCPIGGDAETSHSDDDSDDISDDALGEMIARIAEECGYVRIE